MLPTKKSKGRVKTFLSDLIFVQKKGRMKRMEHDMKVNSNYKIILLNGNIYKGRFLGQKDKKIDFYDWKIKDSIPINSEGLLTVEPIKDGDLRAFSNR